jgi:hypothetical protein
VLLAVRFKAFPSQIGLLLVTTGALGFGVTLIVTTPGVLAQPLFAITV